MTVTHDDPNGWLTPTDTGRAVDAAIREVGAAVHARAETLAADDLANIGSRPELQLPGIAHPPATREEYVGALEILVPAIEHRHNQVALAAEAARYDSTMSPSEAAALREEARSLVEDRVKYARERSRAVQGDSAWDRAESEVRAKAYLAALSEHREFGYPEGKTLTVHRDSTRGAVDLLNSATAYYPRDWLEKEDDYVAEWDVSHGIYGEMTVREKLPLIVGVSGRGFHRIAGSEKVTETTVTVERVPIVPGKPKPRGLLKDRPIEEGYGIREYSKKGETFSHVQLTDEEASGYAFHVEKINWGYVERTRTSKVPRNVTRINISGMNQGWMPAGLPNAIHEYGHRQERINPKINEVMQTHLAIRTQNEDGTRAPLEPYLVTSRQKRDGAPQTPQEHKDRYQGEGKTEWTRPDDFADIYIGKQYPDGRSSEVFTMGMESIFSGSEGGLRGAGEHKADPAHRDLILGTLAVL